VVGVSQLLESDSRDLELVEWSFVSFRRLARTPSHGELRPILESRGKSFGGSRGVEGVWPPGVKGENNWPESFQKSQVFGVVRVGVDRRSSIPTLGVVNTLGVLRESKSCGYRGDRTDVSPPLISW